MWCTRWVLPFLLLPVPTTPPFFLLCFLLSLVLHARPCVYCIVFLVSLFLTSYYWAPVPASTLEVAVSTLNYLEYNGKPVLPYLPEMVQLLDRSWVDHTYGGLFKPFNVTQWEIDSVRHAVVRAIRAEQKAEALLAAEKKAVDELNKTDSESGNSTLTGVGEGEKGKEENLPLSTLGLYMKTVDAMQRSWVSFLEVLVLPRYVFTFGHVLFGSPEKAVTPKPSATKVKKVVKKKQRPPRKFVEGKPIGFGLRSKYDLSPYGIDLVITVWPTDD